MIKSFRHAGLERFFSTGSKAGIQLQLTVLNAATGPGDIKCSGWGLHPLKGELSDHWSIEVSGNWRLTFAFEGTDLVLLDYCDYH